jgi:hypothetical protein
MLLTDIIVKHFIQHKKENVKLPYVHKFLGCAAVRLRTPFFRDMMLR